MIALYDHICWSNVTNLWYQDGKSPSVMSNLMIISSTTGFYCTLQLFQSSFSCLKRRQQMQHFRSNLSHRAGIEESNEELKTNRVAFKYFFPASKSRLHASETVARISVQCCKFKQKFASSKHSMTNFINSTGDNTH